MSKTGDNIYQRKDGRWEGRYIKGRKDKKIQYGYVFGASRGEAKAKLDAISAGQSAAPAQTSPASDSLHALAGEWLEFLKPQLKLASINKYTNLLNSYLLPELGTLPVDQISRAMVSSMLTKLLCAGGRNHTGLSPKTVSCAYAVLKNIFAFAQREKGLPVSDIRNIPIKQPQKQIRILSCEEQLKLSQYLRDHMTPCHLGILVCLYTGLRIGEVCALQWKDISMEGQYLYVSRSMQRVQCLDGTEKRTEIQISSPKSGCSIRRIPLPDELFQLLLRERKADEAFLLTGSEQTYMEPRTMQNRFQGVMKKCAIQSTNFHALRHTFATRCVELGFDAKSLSEILGHSSVNITMNRYVHPSMEVKRRNMNMLSDLLATPPSV